MWLAPIHLLQEERCSLNNRVAMLEAEIASIESSRQRDQQHDSSLIVSHREQLQQLERENATLRSELEVMEGENSRRTTDIEILDSEITRLRTDIDMTTQASQVLEAEKESLILELGKLEKERDAVTSQLQQVEVEKKEMMKEVEYLRSQLLLGQQSIAFASQDTESISIDPGVVVVDEEEVDWGSEGSKEVEHIQRSVSRERSCEDEISKMKQELIVLEKNKLAISEELQASKVKCGKLLQKLKSCQSKNETLQAEIDKLRAAKGGLSDLDQAIEEEFKAQVEKAQQERDELKQRLEGVLNEKDSLAQQCDVLKDAQDRYLDMKEDQDMQIRSLYNKNQELESMVNSMEWKISEMEEALEEGKNLPPSMSSQEVESSSGGSPHRPGISRSISPEDGGVCSSPVDTNSQSRDEIIALETQLDEMSSSNMKIESLNKDLTERVAELEAINQKLAEEKAKLEADLGSLRQGSDKDSKNVAVYKEAFIEQQKQFENLTDEKATLDQELEKANYYVRYWQSEYNSLFADHSEMEMTLASKR